MQLLTKSIYVILMHISQTHLEACEDLLYNVFPASVNFYRTPLPFEQKQTTERINSRT